MENSQIKTEILTAISQELDQWLEEQSKVKDGYEYESRYMLFAQRMNNIVLQKSMGNLPGSRNKKNCTPVLGK